MQPTHTAHSYRTRRVMPRSDCRAHWYARPQPFLAVRPRDPARHQSQVSSGSRPVSDKRKARGFSAADYECVDCQARALLEKRIMTNSGCLNRHLFMRAGPPLGAAGIGPHRRSAASARLELPARPAAALARAQMVQPPDQLMVLPPGQHLAGSRVLAGRSTLSRIMNSSSSGRRSEARCRVSCRSP